MAYSIRNVLTGSAIYSTGQILIRGWMILLIPLYTRLFTTAEYGVIGTVETVIHVLSMTLLLGGTGSQARLLYEEGLSDEDKGSFLFSLNTVLFGAGLTICLLLHAFAQPVWEHWLDPEKIPFHPYGTMAIWASFFMVFRQLTVEYYGAIKRYMVSLGLQAAHFALATGFVLYLVMVHGQGADGKIRGYLFGEMSFVILFLFLYLRHFKARFSTAHLRYAVLYGSPLVLHLISMQLLSTADRLILAHYVPMHNVGNYSLACQLGVVINLLFASFNRAWVPNYYELLNEKPPHLKFEVFRVMALWLTVFGGLCIGGMLFAHEAITLLLPASYGGAIVIVPLIMFANLTHTAYAMFSNALFHQKKTHLLAPVTLFAMLLNIGLNLWWVPTHGVFGAAYATLIAYSIQAVIIFLIARYLLGNPFPTARILACFGFIGGLLAWMLLHPTLPGSAITLALVLKKVGILLAYAGLAYALFHAYLKATPERDGD